jgi:hypothetical protein
MERTSGERPSPVADEMRDFKVALRPTRETGKLVVHVAVSSPTLQRSDLLVEDVTPDCEYLDGDVLVLRFDLVPSDKPPKHRVVLPYVVEDGVAFEYVALMYGPKPVEARRRQGHRVARMPRAARLSDVRSVGRLRRAVARERRAHGEAGREGLIEQVQ